MKSRRSNVRSHLLNLGLLTIAVAGCNSILDNEPGKLRQTDLAGNQPSQTTASSTTSSTSTSGAAGTSGDPYANPTPPAPTPPSPTGECTGDKVLCNGQCVGKDDPAYGCGTCGAPCAIAHGSSTCNAGACAVKQCDRGYDDCNKLPTDGCEVDLSKAESCGSCTTKCAPTAPACSSFGDSFQCGLTCGAATPFLCGTSCVDLKSNPNHCNGCDVACPTIENAESSCTAGQCGFTCRAGFYACGGKCVAANDANACGATCAVCQPTGANTTPTCAGGVCGGVCVGGFADCNTDPADGCEVATATDPANCGGCGIPCNGTCSGGVCTPTLEDSGAPPPPPPNP